MAQQMRGGVMCGGGQPGCKDMPAEHMRVMMRGHKMDESKRHEARKGDAKEDRRDERGS